jgi:hypothetical protein
MGDTPLFSGLTEAAISIAPHPHAHFYSTLIVIPTLTYVLFTSSLFSFPMSVLFFNHALSFTMLYCYFYNSIPVHIPIFHLSGRARGARRSGGKQEKARKSKNKQE